MPGSTATDVILGALKLLGKVDCSCFTSWQDFVKAMPSMFAVEVPANVTNVTLSNEQPDDDQQDNVWFRLDNAGSFVGIFIYSMGDWRQVFPPPNAIFRMYGNSSSVPEGYSLIDSANPHFTAAEVAAIQATWVAAVSPAGTYSVFDVTYEGF